ncbi:MAG: hypothetical protein AB8B69_27350 [Chitinophagales bacterium]
MKKTILFIAFIFSLFLSNQMIQAQTSSEDVDDKEFVTEANGMTQSLSELLKLTEIQQKVVFNLAKTGLYEIYIAELELGTSEVPESEAQRKYNAVVNNSRAKMMHDVKQILTDEQRKILEQQMGGNSSEEKPTRSRGRGRN